jgi:hypothetical protein
VDELSLGLAPVIVDQVYDGLVAIHEQGCALLVVEQQVDRVLAIADRVVLLVKGAVAWEGPARDARPTLEAQMLGGASGNGSAAASMNGSRRVAPQRTAPIPGASQRSASSAPQPPPAGPGMASPGTPPAASAGKPNPAPSGGAGDKSPSHPSDLWVVGPTFPDSN